MAKILSVVVLFAMALTLIAIAKEGPVEAAPAAGINSVQEFLDAHNQARREVGVEAMTWNTSLAKASSLLVRYQREKKGCNFADLKAGKYGGNQLWSQGQVVSAREAVEAWVEEKEYYNHANNSCVEGKQCGTYTQVVWRKSVELGCAQANCLNNNGGASLTICFYSPPGNVVGKSPY